MDEFKGTKTCLLNNPQGQVTKLINILTIQLGNLFTLLKIITQKSDLCILSHVPSGYPPHGPKNLTRTALSYEKPVSLIIVLQW